MKLFAVYLGGEYPKAHIEMHDVRFVAASSIEDTFDRLRADWWGTPGTLHVDCWAEIDHANGWDTALGTEPIASRKMLWFVSLVGCDRNVLAKAHCNLFVVAGTMTEAQPGALATIADWNDAHRDDLYEAEHAFELKCEQRCPLHIRLTRTEAIQQPQFTCRYVALK